MAIDLDLISRCGGCGTWSTPRHRCAVPEAPAVAYAPSGATAPTPPPEPAARVVRRDDGPVTWSAEKDLELLARWSAHFYGRARPLERAPRSVDHVAPEDVRANEWHRAAAVHRRFEALRATPAGREACVVLWLVFVEHAALARTCPPALAGRDDVHPRATVTDGFLEFVGGRLATPAQRAAFAALKRRAEKEARLKDLRAGAARKIAAAVAMWEGGL
jgi:hypothetical protein